MEQLVAESTGKLGKGITPVDREAIAAPEVYGNDRIFVYIRYAGTADSSVRTPRLRRSRPPAIRSSTIEIDDLYEIFGQFFTWEVATAVAGSVMGINPFNQPDVESAKIETRALTAAYEQTGKLPERTPVLEDEGIKLYATDAYAAKLKAAAPTETLAGYLRAHLDQIHPGDYFAALAFLPMFPEHEAAIQGLRHKVRDAKRVATCLGFGPRFLHSTGQDYKGGPNTGVFLQITADHAVDVRDSRPEVQLWRGHRRPGRRGSGGAGVARTPRPAGSPGSRSRRRVEDCWPRRWMRRSSKKLRWPNRISVAPASWPAVARRTSSSALCVSGVESRHGARIFFRAHPRCRAAALRRSPHSQSRPPSSLGKRRRPLLPHLSSR